MGKIIDNSGKNTQNEIYDTSHRQYWTPPGHAAWKDNLMGFFGIILSFLLVMLFDCFVLHPIPAPEGTFDLYRATLPEFRLADSGCEYADARVLSSDTAHHGQELYLVEHDGEIHLIRFQESILFTRKIADDVILANTGSQTLRIGNLLSRLDVTIDSEGRIAQISGVGLSRNNKLTLTIYAVLGVAIAVTGSVLWDKIKKSKNNA